MGVLNWQEDGCQKGSSCEFCHLCNYTEALQRSRRIQTARRRQEEARQCQINKASGWLRVDRRCSAFQVFFFIKGSLDDTSELRTVEKRCRLESEIKEMICQ